MQVVHHCPSNHRWTTLGPCPVCGSDAVTSNFSDGTVENAERTNETKSFPKIPGYEIQKELGAGGMGVVYRARQASLGREVALKLILARELANPQDLKRFMREAEVVAKLNHPNIVQIYDVGVSDAGPYYTMELLGGSTLGDKLESVRMPAREGARLLADVARAVHCAHSHDILHRDLKPANILFTADGIPKLVDFGIAKRLAADDGLTETGKPLGTPGYMSPEQAAGKKEIGPGADVYALGVILYKLLAGRIPFEGDNLYDILHQIITEDPVSPAWYRADVPRDLEAICMKCLRKSPGERYLTAGDLADDLDRYLNHEPIAIGWTPPWRKFSKWCRRHPAWTTTIMIALAVLAGGISVALFYGRRPPVEVASNETTEDPALKLRKDEIIRRVESLLRSEPNPDRQSFHPVTILNDELASPSLDAFEVLSDDRVVDLRAWRKVPANDSSVESFVIFNNRRVLTKKAPVDLYHTEFRTTGGDLFLRAISPNPTHARVIGSNKKGVVGGQAMIVRQLVMDVGGEPLNREFTAQAMATFRNSLQKSEDQWLGLIGFKGSLRSSMLILFPRDRPFTDYSLWVAPTRNDKPVPFAGPEIVFKGENNQWLYWEVGSPQQGHVYRVDWNW